MPITLSTAAEKLILLNKCDRQMPCSHVCGIFVIWGGIDLTVITCSALLGRFQICVKLTHLEKLTKI